MKTLKNATMVILAASLMAACSSTRTAGTGGTSGTTGMGSGSSADWSSTSQTEYDDWSSETVYDPTVVPGSYGVYNSGTYFFANTDYGSGNASRWSEPGVTYDPTVERTPFQYFMNGYQGPLDYVTFSNHTTAQNFLPIAAENGMREVELSKIAQTKSDNSAIRDYATMIINDHESSSQELMSLASSRNVSLPPADYFSYARYNSYESGNMNMGATGSGYISGSGTTVNTSSTMSSTGTALVNVDGKYISPIDGSISGLVPENGSLYDVSGFPVNLVDPEVTTRKTEGSPQPMGLSKSIDTVVSAKNKYISPIDATISGMTPATGGSLYDISGFPANIVDKNKGIARTESVNTSSSMNTVSGSGAGSTSGWYDSGSSNWSSTAMSASAMTTMNELTALNNTTGEQFNQQYLRMMLQDHYQAIQLFKSAAQSSDTEVRAFAEKTLPVLIDHYEKARRLE